MCKSNRKQVRQKKPDKIRPAKKKEPMDDHWNPNVNCGLLAYVNSSRVFMVLSM